MNPKKRCIIPEKSTPLFEPATTSQLSPHQLNLKKPNTQTPLHQSAMEGTIVKEEEQLKSPAVRQPMPTYFLDLHFSHQKFADIIANDQLMHKQTITPIPSTPTYYQSTAIADHQMENSSPNVQESFKFQTNMYVNVYKLKLEPYMILTSKKMQALAPNSYYPRNEVFVLTQSIPNSSCSKSLMVYINGQPLTLIKINQGNAVEFSNHSIIPISTLLQKQPPIFNNHSLRMLNEVGYLPYKPIHVIEQILGYRNLGAVMDNPARPAQSSREINDEEYLPYKPPPHVAIQTTSLNQETDSGMLSSLPISDVNEPEEASDLDSEEDGERHSLTPLKVLATTPRTLKRILSIAANEENQKKFKCNVCKRSFDCKTHLGYHKKSTLHKRNIAACINESKIKPEEESKNQAKIKCTECNRSFTNEGSLKQHKTACHSSERQFRCNQCGKRFDSKTTYYNHKSEHNIQAFKCTKCPMQFSNKKDLITRHINLYHYNNKHYCNICNKEFARYTRMEKHKLIHSKVKKMQANIQKT